MTVPSDKDMSRPPVSRPTTPDEKRLTYRLLIRTTLALTALTVIAMVIAALIIDRSHIRQTYSGMGKTIKMVEDAIESTMHDTVGFKIERAQGFFEGIGKDELIRNLRLMSDDTTVILSNITAELGEKIDLRTHETCELCHGPGKTATDTSRIFTLGNGERIYHFIQPLLKKVSCVRCHSAEESRRGVLVADFSLKTLDKNIADTRLNILITGLALLVVFVVIIAYLLHNSVYRPLSLIAGRMKRIAASDFSMPRAESGRDIIAFINDQIDSTSGQLKSLYENLEDEVQQRTRSLRESQEALSLEKDKLKFVFDNSPQAILGLTAQGEILFSNRMAGRILDHDLTDLESSGVEDSELLKQVFNGSVVKAAISRGQIMSGIEVISDNRNRKKYLEVHAIPVIDQSQQKILLIMLLDITKEKKMKQSLERHERLASIGLLSAGVAHEVGNPLSAISALVQQNQKTADREMRTHNLKLINMHIDRITRIVRNLSDFARVPDETVVETDVCMVVREALEILSLDHRSKNVEIEIKPPDIPIVCRIRRDQLLQAFINVLINALDAVRETKKPTVSVMFEKSESHAYIRISDNGRGIPVEDQERIFEPFFTTKQVGEGTGLGLSVSYRIITDQGGEIQVESSPDAGTTFVIKLRVES